MKRLLFALICCVSLLPMAHAAIVFDTITNPPNTWDGGASPLEWGGPIYATFSTTNAGVLTDAEFVIYPGETERGYLTIELYDDANLASLGILGTIHDGPTQEGGYAPYVWDAGPLSINLAANSLYWIIVTPYNNSSQSWGYTFHTDDVGDQLLFDGANFWTNSDAGLAMQMKLNVDESSPVPEPVTMALSALGLGAIAVIKRRRVAS